MLDTINETFKLLVAAVSGISMVTIHGRRVFDRPRHEPLYDDVQELITLLRNNKDTKNLNIIHNGNCFVYKF